MKRLFFFIGLSAAWQAAGASFEAAGPLHLEVGPAQTTADWLLPGPVRLESWHWYRLAARCRVDPGATLSVSWSETDGRGFTHRRDRRLDRGPTSGFEIHEMEFISRPDAEAFTLTLRAAAVRDFARNAEVEIRELSLAPVRPAESAAPHTMPHAIYNGDFETPAIAGYLRSFRGAVVEVVADGGAAAGRRFLRHDPGPDGQGASHWYCPVLNDVHLEHGGLYRISLAVRGPETPWVLIAHRGNHRLHQSGPAAADVDPESWRRVFRDVIVDGPALRGWRLALFMGGRMDIDDIGLERLR